MPDKFRNKGHGQFMRKRRKHDIGAITYFLNRQLLPVMKNQISILDETTTTEKTLSWRTQLQAEVAAMEADSTRLPWQNGVPTVMVETIEPYRVQLEESYSALCNPIEVGVEVD